MGALVLDTSVVLGFFHADDAHHWSARNALADARHHNETFILPASVVSESMVGAYRSGTAADRFRRMTGLFGPVRQVDEEVALRAAELLARTRSLRLPDALVIATGIVDDAAVLTCDKGLADVDERVRVVQPG
jgi:predicted nucleic acid-binding protein